MDDFQWPTADELAPWRTGAAEVIAAIRETDALQKIREAQRKHYEQIQRAREEAGA